MGNGYPVAAVITRREIADELAKQTKVFSTFGGNPVAAAAALAVLEVSDGTRCATLSCDPDIERIVIGRGLDATIRLADPYVSRAHACLTWQPQHGTHVIEDVGSDNGTFVALVVESAPK